MITLSLLTRSRRAGMTLVEILVSLAAMVVILGAILGIYDVLSRQAGGQMAREAVWLEARNLAQAVEQSLLRHVPAGDLALPGGGQSESFDPQAVAFFASDPAAGSRIWLVRIFNGSKKASEGASQDESLPCVVVERRLANEIGDSAKPPKVQRFGSGQDRFAAQVRFRYASEFQDGLKPVWQDQPEKGRSPLLVEYQITVSDKGKGAAPAALTGAVALNG